LFSTSERSPVSTTKDCCDETDHPLSTPLSAVSSDTLTSLRTKRLHEMCGVPKDSRRIQTIEQQLLRTALRTKRDQMYACLKKCVAKEIKQRKRLNEEKVRLETPRVARPDVKFESSQSDVAKIPINSNAGKRKIFPIVGNQF
ncbi:hypothetical protein COOONC_04742, partial [Cooperia oncophora]